MASLPYTVTETSHLVKLMVIQNTPIFNTFIEF